MQNVLRLRTMLSAGHHRSADQSFFFFFIGLLSHLIGWYALLPLMTTVCVSVLGALVPPLPNWGEIAHTTSAIGVVHTYISDGLVIQTTSPPPSSHIHHHRPRLGCHWLRCCLNWTAIVWAHRGTCLGPWWRKEGSSKCLSSPAHRRKSPECHHSLTWYWDHQCQHAEAVYVLTWGQDGLATVTHVD